MAELFAMKVLGRASNAPKVQELLGENGCYIKTRIGFHEVSEDACSVDGIIVLQVDGPADALQAFYDALNALDGVSCQKITF